MKDNNSQKETATENPTVATECCGCNDCCCHSEDECNCQNDSCECSNEECQCKCAEQDTAAATTVAEMTTEQKLADMQDKHLRLVAEFDNYRKRSARERLDMVMYAGEDIIKGLLPVIDDLERAIKSAESAAGAETLLEGVKLIYQKTLDYLKTKGLQEIDTAIADFNTDLHDAVTKFPAPSPEQKGKIMDTVQKGYKMGDKVIRFARVVVGE
jgi:molecular chaperone GrpE